MSELFSKNGRRYMTLDYDNLTESGIKELTQAFAKEKEKVVEVIASNRKAKKDGQFQKKIQLIFENGQAITITVGEQGDIAQTKLNATVIPIQSAPTVKAYARDVTIAMARNQLKFEKALARKAAAAIKDTSNVKPANRSLDARIQEAKVAVIAANSNLEAERKRLALAKDSASKATSELDRLKTKLSALKSEEDGLIKAIQDKGGDI